MVIELSFYGKLLKHCQFALLALNYIHLVDMSWFGGMRFDLDTDNEAESL